MFYHHQTGVQKWYQDMCYITTKLGSKNKVSNNSHGTHSTPYTNLKIT